MNIYTKTFHNSYWRPKAPHLHSFWNLDKLSAVNYSNKIAVCFERLEIRGCQSTNPLTKFISLSAHKRVWFCIINNKVCIVQDRKKIYFYNTIYRQGRQDMSWIKPKHEDWKLNDEIVPCFKLARIISHFSLWSKTTFLIYVV